eukprot:gene10460-biopygen8929
MIPFAAPSTVHACLRAASTRRQVNAGFASRARVLERFVDDRVRLLLRKAAPVSGARCGPVCGAKSPTQPRYKEPDAALIQRARRSPLRDQLYELPSMPAPQCQPETSPQCFPQPQKRILSI